MTVRTFASLLVLAALGCGESHTGDPDAGGEDAGVSPRDAGRDAGSPRDAGRDAGEARDSGGGTFDSGPILPPIDAGDPFGDAGALGTPEWVPIDVLVDGSTCDPLTACGGDVVGTWDVTGGCVEVPIGEELDACPGATVSGSGRARGRVIFDGTFATRTGQSEVVIELFVPSLCAAFLGGCSALETQIRMAAPDARCVADSAGNCDCAARQVFVIDDADFYTTEDGQIVSASSDRRWDYCVEGTSLRYRDASSSGEREPGIVELGLR